MEITLNKAKISDSTKWIMHAWALFKKGWSFWIGYTVVLAIMTLAPALIGDQSLRTSAMAMINVIAILLSAGVIQVSANCDADIPCDVGTLLSWFSTGLATKLLPVIVIAIGFSVLKMAYATTGFSGFMAIEFIGRLVYGALAMFVIPLIVLRGLSFRDALEISARGVWHNAIPIMGFSVLMIALIVVSIIPFGLGLMITMPLAILSGYTMFYGIFPSAAVTKGGIK